MHCFVMATKCRFKSYTIVHFSMLSPPRTSSLSRLCPIERYHELLDEADIALLPLTSTRFNEHKSDLKFIECAAHGVVSLASPTIYGQTITDGETGLIYRSPGELSVSARAIAGGQQFAPAPG